MATSYGLATASESAAATVPALVPQLPAGLPQLPPVPDVFLPHHGGTPRVAPPAPASDPLAVIDVRMRDLQHDVDDARQALNRALVDVGASAKLSRATSDASSRADADLAATSTRLDQAQRRLDETTRRATVPTPGLDLGALVRQGIEQRRAVDDLVKLRDQQAAAARDAAAQRDAARQAKDAALAAERDARARIDTATEEMKKLTTARQVIVAQRAAQHTVATPAGVPTIGIKNYEQSRAGEGAAPAIPAPPVPGAVGVTVSAPATKPAQTPAPVPPAPVAPASPAAVQPAQGALVSDGPNALDSLAAKAGQARELIKGAGQALDIAAQAVTTLKTLGAGSTDAGDRRGADALVNAAASKAGQAREIVNLVGGALDAGDTGATDAPEGTQAAKVQHSARSNPGEKYSLLQLYKGFDTVTPADLGLVTADSITAFDGTHDEKVAAVIARAKSVLGTPYAWGGGNAAGPTRGIRDGGVADSYGDYNKIGFDCSGLVLYAFAGVGVALPHYTGYQYQKGTKIPISQIQPGDVLFWGPNAEYHTAIYIGDGKMIEAPESGSTVKISPVRYGGMSPYAVRYV